MTSLFVLAYAPWGQTCIIWWHHGISRKKVGEFRDFPRVVLKNKVSDIVFGVRHHSRIAVRFPGVFNLRNSHSRFAFRWLRDWYLEGKNNLEPLHSTLHGTQDHNKCWNLVSLFRIIALAVCKAWVAVFLLCRLRKQNEREC